MAMQVHTENVLAKFGVILILLAGLTPLLAKETLGQILLLSLLLTAVLYLTDLFLMPSVAKRTGNRVAAAGDGLAAAVILRLLAPALGVGLGWGGAIILGVAVGFGEYFLHRWEGAVFTRQ
jgi:hypothetical protein